MNKIPVIIDTDPGIDDTIAIIMAAGSEKIDIKAITTTHGNVGLEGTTKNAMALKEFLGLECPVAKGAAKPMIVSLKDASYVHGENGLAGFELPRPKGTVCEKAAWDVMYDMAKAAGGQMCLLVLGPMTNVALTIMKYPDFKNYIKRIYMMGGSRSYGNHSQYAEFNIWGDPHACQVVLQSGIPITMADLQFGNDYGISVKELRQIYSHAKKLKPMMDAFYAHDMKRVERKGDKYGCRYDVESFEFAIYDATAAAAMLLEGDSLETEDYYVVCETQGSQTEGQTVFDYKGYRKKRPNVQLAVKMDKQKYIHLIEDALAHFE